MEISVLFKRYVDLCKNKSRSSKEYCDAYTSRSPALGGDFTIAKSAIIFGPAKELSLLYAVLRNMSMGRVVDKRCSFSPPADEARMGRCS